MKTTEIHRIIHPQVLSSLFVRMCSIRMEIDMKKINLDGFQIMHIEEKGILFKKRSALGLTQSEVAKKAKIPLQSYQRFESGRRNILNASFQMACRVIEALEMDISKFYHAEYAIGEEIYPSKEGREK